MKQGLFMGIGRKWMALEIPRIVTRKTLIMGIKNPKHGKHASQVGDGYLTMVDFEVAISLGLKIGKMHFLKVQKKAKNASKNSLENRGPKPPRSTEKSLKQRVKRRFFLRKNTSEKAITPPYRPHATPPAWRRYYPVPASCAYDLPCTSPLLPSAPPLLHRIHDLGTAT
jgi:hypothetical protein